MSAAEPLRYLLGVNYSTLSKPEIYLLEAELFTRICDELKYIFKTHYETYFVVKSTPKRGKKITCNQDAIDD